MIEEHAAQGVQVPDAARWPSAEPGSGDPAVDGALEGLAGIPAAPVEEHPGLYSAIHDALLAELDKA